MLERMVRSWWVLALRGFLSIIFGGIAFSLPRLTLTTLVWLWGAYACVDGIFALASALRAAERHERWGMLLLRGATGIAAGIVAFVWPHLTAAVMLYLVAAWAVAAGVLEIAAAVRLRQLIEGEWLMGLSGALLILLGVLLVAMPGAGLLSWVWAIGGFAVVFGILHIALAFRLRALGQRAGSQRAAA